MVEYYKIGDNENMCPRDYDLNVDTQSWGACLCWENGGRRSKYGKSPKCIAGVPTGTARNDANCTAADLTSPVTGTPGIDKWCTMPLTSGNQVCPIGLNGGKEENEMCVYDGEELNNLPEGLGI